MFGVQVGSSVQILGHNLDYVDCVQPSSPARCRRLDMSLGQRPVPGARGYERPLFPSYGDAKQYKLFATRPTPPCVARFVDPTENFDRHVGHFWPLSVTSESSTLPSPLLRCLSRPHVAVHQGAPVGLLRCPGHTGGTMGGSCAPTGVLRVRRRGDNTKMPFGTLIRAAPPDQTRHQ